MKTGRIAWLAGVLMALASCDGSEATASQWVEHAAMDVARSEHPGLTFGDEVIVIGGFVERGIGGTTVTSSVEVYNPEDDVWSSLRDLPEPRHHLMAAVVGERLYAIGGYSENGFAPVDTVWELVDDDWEERRPLPAPLGAGTAVVLDGAVYVVGGTPGPGLLRYDPGSDSWTVLTPPTTPREHLAAVAWQGEIWAIGGRWGANMHASTEIYDPSTDTWREGPSMGEARSGFGAAVVGETVVVAGGEVFEPTRALDSVEWLDPATAEWRPGPVLPLALHGNPLVTLGDRVYLPGGSTRAAGIDNPGTMFSLSNLMLEG